MKYLFLILIIVSVFSIIYYLEKRQKSGDPITPVLETLRTGRGKGDFIFLIAAILFTLFGLVYVYMIQSGTTVNHSPVPFITTVVFVIIVGVIRYIRNRPKK